MKTLTPKVRVKKVRGRKAPREWIVELTLDFVFPEAAR